MKGILTNILVLVGVVVLLSTSVVVIENITTPIIDEANAKAANEAKAEVLPELADYSQAVESALGNYNVGDTGIVDLFKVPGIGYVYQASFQGFQSKIEYMIGLNEDGEVTGYKTLLQGDTPGLGAEIANPVNWAQFVGMSVEDAGAGNIDGLSGATITTNGWKDSLAKVIDFHNNEMLGFIVTDVSSSYTLPDSVVKVEVVSDGTNDLEVVYTLEFTTAYSAGPNVVTVTMNLSDGSVKKLVVNEANDSVGIGADIGASEFAEQFKGMAKQDVIDNNYDVQAGASYPITFGEFTIAMDEMIMFHRVEFEGYVAPVETAEEKLARFKVELSVENATFTDVTADYDLTGSIISKIELANDGSEDIAVLFTFAFEGYNDEEDIIAMIGFDLTSSNLTGFRVLSESETPTLGGKIDTDEFLVQFTDLSKDDAKAGTFDALAGASITTGALIDALADAVDYYDANLVVGEVPETEAQMLQRYILEMYTDAFSVADVSADYTLTSGITRIMEVKDFSNVLLGHVFFVDVAGAGIHTGSNVEFMVGINADQTYTGFKLLDDNETPGMATKYYLDAYSVQYEGLSISAADYGIDEYAGSTLTHDSIIGAVKSVALFYTNNSVGGGS